MANSNNNTDTLQINKQINKLQPNKLLELIPRSLAQEVLNYGVSLGADFVEIYAELKVLTGISLDDRKIAELSNGSHGGVGIRVVKGKTTGYAHTADFELKSLLKTTAIAASFNKSDDPELKFNIDTDLITNSSIKASDFQHDSVSETFLNPNEINKSKKVDLLKTADEFARNYNDKINQVSVSYGDSIKHILIANSEGIYVYDSQTRTNFRVSAVALGDGGLQTGFESVAKTLGFELFDEIDLETIATEAARRASVKLEAKPAPSGELPVILASGSGGILFHEACGHGLEADHIAKKSSVYTDMIGKQVASKYVTLIDDGTYSNEWGTFDFDDEGHPATKSVLIKDGILEDYMYDKMRGNGAKKQNVGGNGRRQSYRYLPMVRMTNTYLLDGDSTKEDIIQDTDYGVYIAQLGGGQVNTATGDFVFGTTEAYLIENGKLTYPLRDANLIGNGPEILKKIDAVGNDFKMSPGTCGKDGQQVPVGCGQATLRVTGITLGGTSHQ